MSALPMRPKDLALALLVIVVWGVNFAVIKVGVVGVPPMLLGALRLGGGGPLAPAPAGPGALPDAVSGFSCGGGTSWPAALQLGLCRGAAPGGAGRKPCCALPSAPLPIHLSLALPCPCPSPAA